MEAAFWIPACAGMTGRELSALLSDGTRIECVTFNVIPAQAGIQKFLLFMNPITNYLKEVEQTHKSGIAREHAYRGFFQNLLHQILPEEIRATNEPARIS